MNVGRANKNTNDDRHLQNSRRHSATARAFVADAWAVSRAALADRGGRVCVRAHRLRGETRAPLTPSSNGRCGRFGVLMREPGAGDQHPPRYIPATSRQAVSQDKTLGSGLLGRPVTCRAAVALAPGKMRVQQVTVDPPREGEARVRMLCASICPMDTAALATGIGAKFPCILGHEGAGIVESVGPDVVSVKPGDYVVPCFLPFCGRCKNCLSGKTNLCDTGTYFTHAGLMLDGSSRFHMAGASVHHFMGTSTLSEYTVVHEIHLAKVSTRAPPDRVCLLSCTVPCGLGAVFNTAQVEEGTTAAVFGINAVGLTVIDALQLSNAKRIIAVDINESKLREAKAWGATDCIDVTRQKTRVQQVIQDMTDGGVDYSFDCVGSKEVMRTAAESCHSAWGQTVLVGALEEPGTSVPLEQHELLNGRSWKGCALGGYKSRPDIPVLVERYLKGEFRLNKLETIKIPLESVQKCFAEVEENNRLTRHIVVFNPLQARIDSESGEG